jgi:hypothetical protein
MMILNSGFFLLYFVLESGSLLHGVFAPKKVIKWKLKKLETPVDGSF